MVKSFVIFETILAKNSIKSKLWESYNRKIAEETFLKHKCILLISLLLIHLRGVEGFVCCIAR